MKRIATFVTVAALAVGVAACGGGSSSSGGSGSGTQPTADTTAAKAANVKMVQAGGQLISNIMAQMGSLPAAEVVKSSSSSSNSNEPTVSCSYTAHPDYSCTATDPQGGTCTVTGSWAASSYSQTITMNCTNFHADSSTVVNGTETMEFKINQAAFSGAEVIGKAFEKSSSSSSSGSCTADQDISDSGFCQETTNTCSASASLVSISFVIGSNGLTISDNCGTYKYDANSKVDVFYCGTISQQSTPAVLTYTVDGTFNGQSVNETINLSCDMSKVS